MVCAECYSPKMDKNGKKDTPFMVCIECFRKGKEKDDHKKNHSYSIMDKMDYPLFDKDWTAIEDITLLKGISLSGIDNWHQISDTLDLKNPADCEAHFYSYYYKSMEDPIPIIEEIGTKMRDKDNHTPVLLDKVLEANQEKKQKFIAERQERSKGKENQKTRNHNKNENMNDNEQIKGKSPLPFHFWNFSLNLTRYFL